MAHLKVVCVIKGCVCVCACIHSVGSAVTTAVNLMCLATAYVVHVVV